jgi:predicted nucleic acid-binding protein/GNAT superfamily N-acetyltransferase
MLAIVGRFFQDVTSRNMRLCTTVMKIEALNYNSPYLPRIKQLWRRNSRTLGFFPEGAFDEHAARRLILAAISGAGELYGYLLYRVVWKGSIWPTAVIVHLCISEQFRKKGISKALVGVLRESKQNDLFKIELKCRRDYDGNKIWPRLGFVYKDEIIGRAGYPLIRWEMEFRQLPLIELIEKSSVQKQIRAVIDANVLYRIQDKLPDSPKREKSLSEEAKALNEDWIGEEIAIYITDESLNEIQRNDDPKERKLRLSFATCYNRLRTDVNDVKDVEERLKPFFPNKPKNSTKSDMRQLAHAIAGNTHFFITQDTGLLKKAKRVDRAFHCKILSPGEFIGSIDESIREAEYKPATFAGSHRLIWERTGSNDFLALYSFFGRPDSGEKKKGFESQVRSFLAQPKRYEIGQCRKKHGDEKLALFVYDRGNPSELAIPLLRISRSQLSGTVLRYLLRQTVLISAREKRLIVRIPDSDILPDFRQAFIECGFIRGEKIWIKYSLPNSDTGLNLRNLLTEMSDRMPSCRKAFISLAETLASAIQIQDSVNLADVERRLWPGKILDANIPTYIISIHPYWAQHLFDEELAKQTLWGSKEDLSLRNENVYYRSDRTSWPILSPGRIFWYVKKNASYNGTMCIRACSSLDEVVVGRATDLYSRFRRLGIYKWKDVRQTAKDLPSGNIMALRFSNTELFRRPIELNLLKNILKENENKSPFLQSPQPISGDSFAVIYGVATKA